MTQGGHQPALTPALPEHQRGLLTSGILRLGLLGHTDATAARARSTRKGPMRHFTSTQDWTVEELQALLDQAAGLRSDPVRPLLQGRTLALLFLNPSLRTRAS